MIEFLKILVSGEGEESSRLVDRAPYLRGRKSHCWRKGTKWRFSVMNANLNTLEFKMTKVTSFLLSI